MIAGRLGQSSPVRGGSRIRMGLLALVVTACLATLAVTSASCGPVQRDTEVRAAGHFPKALDRLLYQTFDENSGVRFSRIGAPEPQALETAIPGFGPSRDPIEQVRLANEIELYLDGLSDTDRLHPVGLYRAIEGELDHALAALEAATLEEPTRSDLWTDLSAVYLLRYRDSRHGRDLVEALRSAERGFTLAPESGAAAFNRAEALTELSVQDQAVLAWEAFLRLEADGGWGTVAEQRRASLTRESTKSRCEGGKRDALTAWRRDGVVPAEAVHALPHCFRMWVLEEQLPAWARAWRSAEPGAPDRLAFVSSIGKRIAAVTGDRLISDAIGRIEERIRVGDHVAVARMANALDSLGIGLDAYRRQEYSVVRPAMEEVVRGLRGVINPLVGLASYYLGVLDYYAGPAEAAAGFEEILTALPIDRYPHLQGFCVLMLGTIEGSADDPESSVELYRSALPLLERSAGDEAGVLLYPALGDGLRLLGRADEAWRAYLLGLQASARSGNPRRYATALYTVAELLLESGDADVALVFGEELVANAGKSDLPSVIPQAYLQRGRARHELGLVEEAVDDLYLARDLVEQIEGQDHRERIAGAVELAIAALEVERVPAAALERLDLLVEDRVDRGYLYRMPNLLLLRSRAYGALGQDLRQEEELLAALEFSEQPRVRAKEPANRRALLAQAREIYEETLKLRIGREGAESAAFEISEHGRARELRESIGVMGSIGGETGFRPYGLNEVQSRLPSHVVIIEFFVLPDRLVTWTVSRNSFRQRVHPIDRDSLTALVDGLVLAMERRAPMDSVRERSAEMFDLLAADALADVPPGAPLVFVPDRFLAEVPFTALYDTESGKYLAQVHPVAVNPSATVSVDIIEDAVSSRQGQTTPTSILAVGDPAFSARSHPHLVRLPLAEQEAARVAALFPRGEALAGAQATEEAVVATLGNHPAAYFASHAIVDPAVPERSALILAAGEGSDGRLTAAEIARLDLSHLSLVVLAVCDPVQGSDHGDEGLTGLVAAFLQAGVGSVVAPTQPVSESGTSWLVSFQRAVAAGSRPSTAFQEAQESAASAMHPGDWSAFRWIGALDPGKEN